MNHVQHIAKNKENLFLKFQILRLIREFFWNDGFLEVETPNIVSVPGQEPHLFPVSLDIHDEKGKRYKAYLHTSPEYTMKKMLASGFENIFSICKCFRDHESFGGLHNLEFTMLEWYRAGADFWKIMDDVESLLFFISKKIDAPRRFSFKGFNRVRMRDLWMECLGVDLDSYLDSRSLAGLCKKLGYEAPDSEKYEDLFYKIFLNKIEPDLKNQSLIIHHYPAQMAALAKLSEDDPRYAERFEAYVDGIELANAFSELTDSKEQLDRLKKEYDQRLEMGKEVFEIDYQFVSALDSMPECAGIALGVDRTSRMFADCENIDDVLVLPMSKMFN